MNWSLDHLQIAFRGGESIVMSRRIHHFNSIRTASQTSSGPLCSLGVCGRKESCCAQLTDSDRNIFIGDLLRRSMVGLTLCAALFAVAL